MLTRIDLTAEDRDAVAALCAEAAGEHPAADDPAFLREAPLIAHRLPRAVRAALAGLHADDGPSALVIGGLDVPDEAIGPTPSSWREGRPVPPAVHRLENALVLYSSLLGDVFGWATQQDGRLVHDVVPTRGHEGEQLGSGSTAPLMWHTEEAFHPCRADYVVLMCLRNPDGVATTVGGLDPSVLTEEERRCAFEPRFRIRPDKSHLQAYNTENADRHREGFDRTERMNEEPDAVPVLFGAPHDPFLQIDPAYMDTAPGDESARRTLDRIGEAIEDGLTDVPLRPGDVVFIDNFRLVHGRQPFKARYDGTDRWLKRVNVTRDLRKSSAMRRPDAVRVVA